MTRSAGGLPGLLGALGFAALVVMAGVARGEEVADAVARQVAAGRDSGVVDTGSLLSAEDVTALQAARRELASRGLRAMFVTVPDAVAPGQLQGRLGEMLGLGPDDLLLVASRTSAHCKAPALKGDTEALAKAFRESKADFALGTRAGLVALASRSAELVARRRAREATLARAGAAGLAVLILAGGALLGLRVGSDAARRAAAESAGREPLLDSVSLSLYELAVLTEEQAWGHAVYLEAWRRYGEVRRTGGAAELEELGRYLDETLARSRSRL